MEFQLHPGRGNGIMNVNNPLPRGNEGMARAQGLRKGVLMMFQEMMDTIGFVSGFDPEVGEAMKEELARQRRNLELIASENIVSPAVMAAMGTVLTNKYAEGYPSKRYYGGCDSPIPELRPIWRFISPCLRREIRCWA